MCAVAPSVHRNDSIVALVHTCFMWLSEMGLALCCVIQLQAMAALAVEASNYLQQLMGNEGKEQDELIKQLDDDKVDALPHEGYVLSIGKFGAQNIMHCLTYETISLPGAPCFFCVVYCMWLLWIVLFHVCVMCVAKV